MRRRMRKELEKSIKQRRRDFFVELLHTPMLKAFKDTEEEKTGNAEGRSDQNVNV